MHRRRRRAARRASAARRAEIVLRLNYIYSGDVRILTVEDGPMSQLGYASRRDH
jgi:hypothetical protein